MPDKRDSCSGCKSNGKKSHKYGEWNENYAERAGLFEKGHRREWFYWGLIPKQWWEDQILYWTSKCSCLNAGVWFVWDIHKSYL